MSNIREKYRYTLELITDSQQRPQCCSLELYALFELPSLGLNQVTQILILVKAMPELLNIRRKSK